jgi:hypothetical protein
MLRQMSLHQDSASDIDSRRFPENRAHRESQQITIPVYQHFQ